MRPAAWLERFRGAEAGARRARRRCGSTGSTRSARSMWKRPTRRSTCWPTAGCSTRPLRCRLWARSGYYQSGGAFGFRDQLQDAMALVHAEPRLLREHLLRARPASFAKATCSTGGIRPPAAACARIVRTTTCGCRWRPAAMSLRTGDTGVLDETVPLPRRPPGQCRRRFLLRPAGPLRRDGHPVRPLRARHSARPALRRARPAADGVAAIGTTA